MMKTGRIIGCPVSRLCKLEGTTGARWDSHGKLAIVLVSEAAEGNAGLVQLRNASQPFGSPLCLANCGQQNSGQDGNNRYDA
jgi:hypothetical protein